MIKISYKKEDQAQLIFAAQNNDIKALEELIRRIQKDIYSIFSHLTNKKDDVSDLTQETLLKMAHSIKQLKDISTFRAWLNKIITNTFYDYLHKNKELSDEYNEELLKQIKDEITCEPGEKCIFTEIEKIIRAAILSLPQNLRITIILREFEGLSYQDISKITNASLGTVKSRISRARVKLQEELRDFI